MNRRDFFKGALAIIAAPLLSLLPERKEWLPMDECVAKFRVEFRIGARQDGAIQWLRRSLYEGGLTCWVFPQTTASFESDGKVARYKVHAQGFKYGPNESEALVFWDEAGQGPLPVQKEAGK